jgi:tRNA-dependent cyclodipeptide synthase
MHLNVAVWLIVGRTQMRNISLFSVAGMEQMGGIVFPAEHDYVKDGNLFIPISLGNHYYSSDVLRRLMSDFIPRSNLSIIFLCDRLRFLSYLIRGETDRQRITANIKIQVGELTRALIKLGLESHPNASIADWSFCREDGRYKGLLAKLQQFVRDDATVRRELYDCVNRLLAIHGRKGTSVARCAELQFEYITEETALSLYMTEIRGYDVEVYRRAGGFVDYLYAQRPADLRTLTGKLKLSRKFISLEEGIAPAAVELGREALPTLSCLAGGEPTSSLSPQ